MEVAWEGGSHVGSVLEVQSSKDLTARSPDVEKIGELLARELLLDGFQVGNRVRPIVGRLAVHKGPSTTPVKGVVT